MVRTDAGTSALTLETTGKLTLRNGASGLGTTTVALTPGTVSASGSTKSGVREAMAIWRDLATGAANLGAAFAVRRALQPRRLGADWSYDWNRRQL